MEKKRKAEFPTPYKLTEQSEALRIRYIYCQCYEICLPGGTKIVTDPFISGAVDDFTIDQLSGADYILLNHTHFDHDMDTGKLWEKFHGRIICQKEVAHHIADLHPNIMIRHRIRTCPPEEYARQCISAGVQYILPWHHNNALVTGEDLNSYMEAVNRELEKQGNPAKAFNPEPYRWYSLYLGFEGL